MRPTTSTSRAAQKAAISLGAGRVQVRLVDRHQRRHTKVIGRAQDALHIVRTGDGRLDDVKRHVRPGAGGDDRAADPRRAVHQQKLGPRSIARRRAAA